MTIIGAIHHLSYCPVFSGQLRNAWRKATRRMAALKTLYAALSAEQKALLDQGFAEGGPGLHGGPGHRFR